MKRKLEKSGKLAIVFALLAFILWNCKEDPNSTGMELLLGSDLKTVDLAVDSTSIKAYTENEKVRRVVLKGASSHAGIRLQVMYTKLD